MKIIFGLGNPGKQYEHTRHNAGLMAVDYLAAELKLPIFNFEKKFNAEMAAIVIGGKKVIFVKPRIFMNESGLVAAPVARFFKAKPEDLMVIHDDKDILLGEIRCQTGRGSAGHNGVQSVIDHLGSKNFTRIRIGISSEKLKKTDAADFVLSKFGKQEIKIIEKNIFPKIGEEVRNWIK
jgi:peptidyl-tRNA hydrolase, PTH1 family